MAAVSKTKDSTGETDQMPLPAFTSPGKLFFLPDTSKWLLEDTEVEDPR